MATLCTLSILFLIQIASSHLFVDISFSKRTPGCINLSCPDPSLNLTIVGRKESTSYQLSLENGSRNQIPIMDKEVSFNSFINSPDPRFKSLLRVCDQAVIGNLTNESSVFNITQCYEMKMKIVSADGMNVNLLLEWWILIPTLVSLTLLILALIGVWIQRRRAKSFRVLFEEHLIQTASSQHNAAILNSFVYFSRDCSGSRAQSRSQASQRLEK
ncbi:unnamed protein product [Bursaphelenchus xylophilus]|uniref:(pine wood nematode) hypothetical protein n=1 Tax=Bursaphelenchus xylophilus TaxID=6326 RepID=A0A1I7SAG9_BURXY|nr:unnamed protein product [Bursaphelenchus xylophilus]CAG9083903.1 unnamed protein product [Bursaphelenchus xylophilus]